MTPTRTTRSTPEMDKEGITDASPEALANPLWWLQQAQICAFQIEICPMGEVMAWAVMGMEARSEANRLAGIEDRLFAEFITDREAVRAELR